MNRHWFRPLQDGIIPGAGFGCFADDAGNVPMALMQMDNVVLSPHQASATFQHTAGDGGVIGGKRTFAY